MKTPDFQNHVSLRGAEQQSNMLFFKRLLHPDKSGFAMTAKKMSFRSATI